MSICFKALSPESNKTNMQLVKNLNPLSSFRQTTLHDSALF